MIEIRIKPTIYLSLLTFYLSSCQWTSKIEKGGIIMHVDSVLPNYSYKGYDVSPFAYFDYTMPFDIGDEYFIRYQTKTGVRFEKHQIVDTISKINSFNRKSYITIPIFEDGSSHIGSLDEMLFFKGFVKFNTNFGNEINTYEISKIEKKASYDEIYHSWKRGKNTYRYSDKAFKKENINEISFSINSKKQVLIRKFSIDNWQGTFFIKTVQDLDSDGINDLVIEAYHDSESIAYYFLFLSSEAEKDQIWKHVATKTFVYDKNTYQ